MRWWTTTGVICALLSALTIPATASPGSHPSHPGANPHGFHATDADRQESARAQAPDQAFLDRVNPEFLAAAEPIARAVAAEYGVPASVTAAQSILESGWGRSELAVADRNYFGFKCVAGRPGPIASGCREYPTTECTPECHPATAAFRVYPSMTDSFRDYGRLLTTSKYYAGALPFVDDAKAFITEVAKSYATDPEYAGKVIRLMDQHDLYRFDGPR